MARTKALRPWTSAFLLGVIPVFAACNGHVISLGNTGTGDTLQPISGGAAKASATPSSCPAGWAHPNICCSASATSTPSCGAWEENPFRACETGTTTYPDPNSCCSLSDPKTCSDNPPSSGPVPPPPPPIGCGYACPPGWWQQAAGAVTPGGVEGAMCCTAMPGGVTECVAQGSGDNGGSTSSSCGTVSSGGGSSSGGGGSSSGGPGGPITIDASVPDDGGIVAPPDASSPPPIDDAGCPTPVDAGGPYPGFPGFDGGPASLCGVCPTGWAPDAVQPELCCEDLSDGTRLCFSQASGSATSTGSSNGSGSGGSNGSGVGTPPSSGPGGPSSGWGSGGGSATDGGPSGPSCSGSDTTCSCENTVNGHTYALDCVLQSNGAIGCTCTEDGASGGLKPGVVTSCQDPTAVQAAFGASGCGFP